MPSDRHPSGHRGYGRLSRGSGIDAPATRLTAEDVLLVEVEELRSGSLGSQGHQGSVSHAAHPEHPVEGIVPLHVCLADCCFLDPELRRYGQ